jgi:hypothetical protein
MVRVEVAAVSTAGVAGVDENHLTTGLQGLMAVLNSMSLWNNLPSKTEHDEAAAAADGDAHKHSLTKTTEAEKVLLLWRTPYLKEEDVHALNGRMKKRKEEEDHKRNDDAAANCYYDLRASHDNDPN